MHDCTNPRAQAVISRQDGTKLAQTTADDPSVQDRSELRFHMVFRTGAGIARFFLGALDEGLNQRSHGALWSRNHLGSPRNIKPSLASIFSFRRAAATVIPAVTGGMKTVTAVMTGIMTIAFCTIGIGPILEVERKRER